MDSSGLHGTLQAGAPGNVTILCVLEGQSGEFQDYFGTKIKAERRIVPQMTIKDGTICYARDEFFIHPNAGENRGSKR